MSKKNIVFASVLKELISKHKAKYKLTLEKLGEEIGLTKQNISAYCLGKSTPNYETLVKLADYFGVSCDYLLTGKDKDSEELGLSGTVIGYLKKCSQDKLDLINMIISNDLFDGSIDGAVKLIIECGYNKDNVIDKMLFGLLTPLFYIIPMSHDEIVQMEAKGCIEVNINSFQNKIEKYKKSLPSFLKLN